MGEDPETRHCLRPSKKGQRTSVACLEWVRERLRRWAQPAKATGLQGRGLQLGGLGVEEAAVGPPR